MQVCNYPDNRQHLPLPAIPCGGSLQCPRSLLTQEENEYCSSYLRSSVRHNTQWHVFAVAAVLGEDKAGDTLRGNSQSECVWISGEQEGVMNELEVERERGLEDSKLHKQLHLKSSQVFYSWQMSS